MRCRLPCADDLDDAALAVREHEGHGDDGLQRIALRAARRRDIGFARRGAGREVEDRLDRPGRQARPVVGDRDAGVVDADRDLRRDAGFLAGVERVVEELLDDDQRPFVDGVPGLRLSSLSRQKSSSREVAKVVRV